ncbi:hypothetical protein T459_19376 [Capsicum annuum]|uniref:Uncharacterized protein n=1 Tax=Capsicum annuum TaxID=4072 RepID=A0A2G2Z1N2_CAPAN|nr:hypothetical protein T459_19376 [Capsicum annuum]
MGLRQTIDGRIIKKEPVYGGNSPFAFGPHGSYLESRFAMGDASVSSFSSVDSNMQPLNEPLLDVDTTSFGFLGEMPQNFGFSDLTADFTNSSALKSLFLLIEYDVLGLGEFATCLFSYSLFGSTVLFDWVCLDVLVVVAEGTLLSDNSTEG